MKSAGQVCLVFAALVLGLGSSDAAPGVTKAQLIGKWDGTLTVSLAVPAKRNQRAIKLAFELKQDGTMVSRRYGQPTPGTFVIAKKGEVWFADKKGGVVLIWLPTRKSAKHLVGPVRPGPGQKPTMQISATLALTRK